MAKIVDWLYENAQWLFSGLGVVLAGSVIRAVVAHRSQPPPDELRCSFCDKPQREVDHLIAARDVYICDRCIDLSTEIIDEPNSDHDVRIARACAVTLQLADTHLPRGRRAELLEELDALVARIRPRRRPKPGDVVAGAALVRIIGAGNFATVWQAEEDDATVAVKIFDPDKITIGLMLWRFHRGIRAMQHLTDLSAIAPASICRIRQVSKDGLAFSMDYMPGGDLVRLSALGWTLDKKLAAFEGLAEAVAFAHRHGIVHRDLKPANVVLDETGDTVLTDFDIADLAFAATQSMAAASLGSPHFAAPEQLLGEELIAHPSADVFSLGKLLYFLLTEQAPPLGGTERDETPAYLSQIIELSIARHVIATATRNDPTLRYQSVEDLVAALSMDLSEQPR